jgi:enterochelin esterase family protein
LIAVFVPPIDRQNEYAGNKKDLFTTFIISELFPVIDKKYSTSKDPQKRATFGISDGGNIALYIGANSPESFGKVAAMSSDVQLEISTKMKRSSKMNLEFYLDMGTYDLPELIPMVNDFTRILKDKHYSYQYYHWHEGHSWENWRTHLSYPLRQFFPVK